MGEKSDQVAGRAKQAVGDLTDDDDLRREGEVDEKTGKIKEKLGDIKDKVEDAVDDAADKVKDKVNRDK